jgi:PAS domain-containing protein
MRLGLFHFELLYDVLQDMHFLYDEEQMAEMVLSKMSPALDAEAGTIFRAEKDGRLYPLASYGVSKENLRKAAFKTGVGVVGWVAQYLQPVKVDRPETDARFLGAVDTRSGFRTRNIVASPIIVRNELIGIIEFLNRRGGPFVIQDLELISMVGRQVGIAMVNARVMKERDDLLAFQEAVVGSLSAGLLVIDPGQKVLRANNRAAEILGWEGREALEGHPVSEILSACKPLLKALEDTAASAQGKAREEAVAEIRGKPKKIGYSTVPVLSKSGESLGAAVLFQDITEWNPVSHDQATQK